MSSSPVRKCRTMNIMSTIELWGLKPHCSCGRMPSRSQYEVAEAAREDV